MAPLRRFPLIIKSVKFLAAACLFTAGFLLVPRQHRGDRLSDEKLEATYALDALRWYNDQRTSPGRKTPPLWRERAMSALAVLHKGSSTASMSWTSVGPANYAGRVRSIAIDTVNHFIYAGSVSGGIWKSSNAGSSWTPIADAASNMVIGSIAIDPTNPSTVYAGTGEGLFNYDALRGIGVLKSTDGGASWSVLNNFVGATSTVGYVNKILVRPDNPATLFAAVSSFDVGIWKSTDAGSSWSKLQSAGGAQTGGSLKFCTDLVMDPSNSNVLYAAFGLTNPNGIWKSSNGGTSWTKLTNGFPSPSTKYLRISLAIARSNPQVLYACLCDSNYYTHSIQKTTDGGASWSAATTPFDPAFDSTHLGGQGWYNNVIAVDPTNPNVVYTGGINVFRSSDAGASWARISDGYGGGIHVDQHAIVFDPSNPSIIYFGNDGGVYRSTNGGASFASLNSGLVIAQFYSGAVQPIADVYYGGTQDNGTLKSVASTTWTQVFSGDGGVTLLDPGNVNTIFTEYVYLDIQKSTNGGVSFQKMMNGIPTGANQQDGTTDRVAFIAPMAMDPSNPQNIVAGTYRVFRTMNQGVSWSAISNDLTGDGPGPRNGSGRVITALAIAKSSSSTIYAGTSTFGTAPSHIQVTTNTGTSWSDVTRLPLPNRYVTAIGIDPLNADRVILTFSGFSANTPSTPGHVFLTANRGASWSNISGNLPDIPANTLLLDSADSGHFLLGTDLGVFESTDGGTTWLPQNSGMANVSVSDLDIRADRFVFAATHGRGMFKSSLPFGAPTSDALAISVLQNSVLSAYADFFVTAAESITSPSLTVTVGPGPAQSVALSGHTYRVFKGEYQFLSSGTTVLTAYAHDSLGRSVASSRAFQTQLMKSAGGMMQSQGGDAALVVNPGILREDVYFTMIPETADAVYGILGTSYQFGPARIFPEPLSVRFFYTPDQLGARSDDHLTVLEKTGDGWIPLPSTVDPAHASVTARVSRLGVFSLAYRPEVVSPMIPKMFALSQNFPNPFNPSTTIRFSLPENASITLKVYDVSGREVNTLAEGSWDAGTFDALWSGRNSAGEDVASGIYFYRLAARSAGREFHASGKMVLIR